MDSLSRVSPLVENSRGNKRCIAQILRDFCSKVQTHCISMRRISVAPPAWCLVPRYRQFLNRADFASADAPNILHTPANAYSDR